ncbi:MAG: tetratricopeptide repeat protein [Deltaproteobacteria bacterium]|nr:tetratricopeptide repeat protein [Deltaproteobacteria bacterium]
MSATQVVWLCLGGGGAAAAIVGLEWLARRRRTAALTAFASKEALGGLVVGPVRRQRAPRALLLGLAALLSTLALNESRGRPEAPPWRAGADLVVVLDCSRSMLAQDVRADRLALARSKLLKLLDGFHGRVALVPFAGAAFLQCPLTWDVAAVRSFVSELSPDDFPLGGSAVAEALETGVRSFEQTSRAGRTLLLVTDGDGTTGGFEEAGRRIARSGARLIVLGVGSPEGAPVPVRGGGFASSSRGVRLSRLAEAALQELAVLAGGTYIRVGEGPEDLNTVAALLATADSARRDAHAEASSAGAFRWFLGGATAGLVLRTLLGLGPRVAPGLLLLLASFLPSSARAASAESLVEEGIALSRAGDHRSALGRFLSAQVEAPERAEIAYDLGNAFYRTGRFEEALRSYAAVPATSPPRLRAWALYNMGNSAYRLGRYERASEYYRAALRLDPRDVDVHHNLEIAERAAAEAKASAPCRPRRGAGIDRGGKGAPGPSNGAARPPSARASPSPGAKRPVGSEVPSGGEPAGNGPGTEGRDWRERVLGRLPDRSSKALPAQYGLRPVERDW